MVWVGRLSVFEITHTFSGYVEEHRKHGVTETVRANPFDFGFPATGLTAHQSAGSTINAKSGMFQICSVPMVCLISGKADRQEATKGAFTVCPARIRSLAPT
jgi:hypothetical protein